MDIIIEQSKINSTKVTLLRFQLRWTGYASWKRNLRLPNITLFGELSTGHHDKGAQRKGYKNDWEKIHWYLSH